jgi:hypothetical protein
MKKEITLKAGLITLSILVILSFNMGCSGFRGYTFHNQFADCSFEYPSSYNLPSTDDSSEDSIYAFSSLKQSHAPNDAYFIIDISEVSDSFPNTSVLLDFDLNIAQQGQSYNKFYLLERTPITVAGAQGEQAVYSYLRISDTYHTGEIEYIPAISYRAYFEKNGNLLEIIVDSIIERAEQSKMDFEHLINTFKFLD